MSTRKHSDYLVDDTIGNEKLTSRVIDPVTVINR